jgi:pyruvate ferredoxin oxidoreductase gamma subunit/2-oxoisovalerate ferredoxin oxidoreductase gamma subunit
VLAFNRFDDKPIWVRSDVYEPDVVAVLDFSLLAAINVLSGLKPNGVIIINSAEDLGKVKARLGFQGKAALVNATEIALKVLRIPIVNTAMVGAFVKATGVVKLDSAVEAVIERFGGKTGERNAEAIKKAYQATILG